MDNYYNNSENEYARNDSASNIEPQVTSNQPVKQKKKGSGKVGRFFGRLALLIVSGLVFGLCAAAAFGIVNYYAPKGDDKEAAAESFDMETYKTQIERDIINRINRERTDPEMRTAL